MWRRHPCETPEIGEQVVGFISRRDGLDEIAWWTLTQDGWYVTNTLGNLGHRDAMTREDSQGPDAWTHRPTWQEYKNRRQGGD